MDELKPCPCCGHEAKWKKEWIGNALPTEYWYILCVNEKCHLRTPGYQKEYYQKALEIWNNRDTPNKEKFNAHETLLGKALDAGHIYR